MNLKVLIGSGDKIVLLILPILLIGIIMNMLSPSFISVGGPPPALTAIFVLVLLAGIAVWVWSAISILIKVPRNELITTGPYSLVKHPLYTGVAFLVLPWLGFLLNSWLGLVIGCTLYLGSRIFSPEEEKILSQTFGPAWDTYCSKVKIPWL